MITVEMAAVLGEPVMEGMSARDKRGKEGITLDDMREGPAENLLVSRGGSLCLRNQMSPMWPEWIVGGDIRNQLLPSDEMSLCESAARTGFQVFFESDRARLSGELQRYN